MTSETFHSISYTLNFLSLLVFLIALRYLRYPSSPGSSDSTYARNIAFVSILLVGLGLWIRVHNLDSICSGTLSQEEVFFRDEVANPLWRSWSDPRGISHIAYVAPYMIWIEFFGAAPQSLRAFSAVGGIFSMIALLFVAKGYFGWRIGVLSTGLLGSSLYAQFFSKLALETSSSLLYFSLVLLLFEQVNGRHYKIKALLRGLIAGTALFSYGGTLLGVGSFLLVYFFDYLRRTSRRELLSSHRGWFVIGLILCLFGGLILHRVALGGEGLPLMGGGGGFVLSLTTFVTGLAVMLVDLFGQGISWYLFLPSSPVIDRPMLLLALSGLFIAWKGNNPSVRALVLALPVAVILSPFLGAFPGARRILFILPVICLFGGVGLSEVLRGRTTRGYSLCVLALFFIHSIQLAYLVPIAEVQPNFWLTGDFIRFETDIDYKTLQAH